MKRAIRRKCINCLKTKKLERDFPKDNGYNDGYSVRCRACWAEKSRKYNSRMRNEVFAHYGLPENEGYICSCCRETIKEFLTLDHVNNDGAIIRKQFTGRNKSIRGYYTWLINHDFPPEHVLQVLCSNCNTGKFRNNGICPHQDPKHEAFIRKQK